MPSARKLYVVRDSASGVLWWLWATDADDVYRVYAREIEQRDEAYDPDFDTGNVDIDVIAAPARTGAPMRVDFEEE